MPPSAMPPGRHSTPRRCIPSIHRRLPSSPGVSVGVFEAVFGAAPSTPVVASDLIDPRIQRRFANVKELADETRNVRIWGGIHFRNSLDVGYQMGLQTAAFLVTNSIKPTN